MRVGVLADTPTLSGWRRAVFERVRDSADLALIILSTENKPSGFGVRVWALIDWLERQFAKRVLHPALARARAFDPKLLDGGALNLAGTGIAQAPVRQTDAIRDADLDVIVDLCSRRDDQISPTLARRGLWRLVSNQGGSEPASPFGFWEYYRGAPLSDVSVVARTSQSETAIASASYCNFLWSWSMNDILLGLKASWLLADTLRKQGSVGPLADHARAAERQLLHAPIMLARHAARLGSDAAERALSDDRWRILLAKGDPLGRRAEAPTIIEPPEHSYWADPFVLVKDGKHHLFFEEYFYNTRRGVISHVCVEDPRPGETLRDLVSTVVIDQPHHLSYPFIFTHQGGIFMIPESSAARTVEIWQATNFPHGWARVATPLANVAAADTSLLEWNGRWWLFTNIDRSGVGDHRSELHVFHAPDPIAGPWTAHPANPVVSDARCGRMAGGFLFAADGRPIRCGQVQGRKYGERVSYRLVTELTETAYSETSFSNIEPIPVAPGARTHHVAARDGAIVVDECFVVPKWKRR